MATSDDRRAATLASLVEQLEAADPARIVDVLDAELRRTLGIEAVWLYIVDYGAETLRPVPPAAAAPPPPDALPVRTTVAGRAFLSQTPLWATAPRPLLWVPLSQRGEHLGLLALVHDGSAEARARIAPLATALGLLVASAVAAVRGSYDALQIARGALELELAAAIQWGCCCPRATATRACRSRRASSRPSTWRATRTTSRSRGPRPSAWRSSTAWATASRRPCSPSSPSAPTGWPAPGRPT
jgi:hypothetical protein